MHRISRSLGVFSIVALVMSTGCVNTVPLDNTAPVEIVRSGLWGVAYVQGGQFVSRSSVSAELSDNEQASRHITISNLLILPAIAAAGAGGWITGAAIGKSADPEKSIDGAEVGLGIGIAAGGIALGAVSDNQYYKAVELYNQRFDVAPDPNLEDDFSQNFESDDEAEHESEEVAAATPARSSAELKADTLLERPAGPRLIPFWAAWKDGGGAGLAIVF